VDEKTGGVTQRYLAVWELEGDLKEILKNAGRSSPPHG
jgi:hypothetical protein